METNINHVLELCRKEQVTLRVEGGNLEVSYDDTLSDELLDLLRQTKAQLIDALINSPASENIDLTLLVKQEQIDGVIPLSFGQQRVWFLNQLQPGVGNYIMSQAFRVQGSFSEPLAAKAMDFVIAKHEILRTVYIDKNGEVSQVINAQPQNFVVDSLDISQLEESAKQVSLEQHVKEINSRGFDLQKGFPVRATAIRIRGGKESGEFVLVFNIHHIACDGWSLGVLVDEFTKMYEKLAANSIVNDGALPVQYADYARWQHQNITSSDWRAQADYWREQLTGVEPVHNLPLDFSRNVEKRGTGKHLISVFDLQESESIRQSARNYELTPFMFLHGILSLVLARRSASNDIVIGTAVANRRLTQVEGLIGFFANTLALRVNIDFATLDEYFAHVKRVNLEALSNQDVPYEIVLDQRKIVRRTDVSPLIQLFFSMNTTEEKHFELSSLTISPFQTFKQGVRFELDVSASFKDGALEVLWTYDETLFEQNTIERVKTHFEELIKAITAGTSRYLSSLPSMSKSEFNHLVNVLACPDEYLASLNNTRDLGALFCQMAKQYPESDALETDGKKLSYRELDRRSNGFAQSLLNIGVSSGELVGLCVNRGEMLFIALLGIIKAGAAYVPLDPAYPRQRLEYILSNSGAKALVTESDLSNLFIEFTGVTLPADAEVAEEVDLAPVLTSKSELAYVIYTSGSTGKPKGVSVGHDSVLALISWTNQEVSPTDRRRVLCSTSMCFDLFVYEIWAAWSCGGCIVCVSTINDVIDLKYKPSLINTVPSAMTMLLEKGYDCPGTMTIHLCGEVLSEKLLNDIFASTQVRSVINFYGPTEDTVYSTWAKFEGPVTGGVPIGRAITNTQTYVLDNDGGVLPEGAVGELYLGGAGLAIGYFNLPELTAERFVTARFGEGQRLYRTGDLVRWRSDGQLEFIGRSDTQIKLRGYRIELGEIEAQLLCHEYVKQAAVVVNGAGEDHATILAFVTSDQQDDVVLKSELDRALRETLPEYMLPSAIFRLESMPYTPNGKLDKQKLLEIKTLDLEDDVKPDGEVELALHEVWCEILKRQEVGATQNFFAIGGNSIAITRLVNHINQQFKIDIKINDLFHRQTVRSQAELIKQVLNKKAHLESVMIDTQNDTELLEL